MKNLGINSKLILISFGQLFGIILLLIFSGNFAFGKISEVRQKITKAKSDQTILSQKVGILSSVENDVLTLTQITTSALPGGNPALVSVSQFKNLAVSNGVTLSNIKTGGEIKDRSGLMRVDITFEVDGNRSSVVSFLRSIDTLAPITRTEKAKINEIGGAARASVTTKSFWVELPKKLPALTDKLTELTSDEQRVLDQISTLIQPTFVEVTASDVVGQKEDPFSF